MERKIDIEITGAAQAVLLSAMIGMVTLSLVNLGTELSEAFKEAVWQIGRWTMPGAQGIGPYSGKQTLSLAAWLFSWLMLTPALGEKGIPHRATLILFLGGLGLATTLLWPPATHLVVELIQAR